MSRGVEARGSVRTLGVPRALVFLSERRGFLIPPREAGGIVAHHEGLPGADTNNTGDDAWLLSNPSPSSGEGRSEQSEDRGGVLLQRISERPHPARTFRSSPPSPLREEG
jgi:hypothetical protein